MVISLLKTPPIVPTERNFHMAPCVSSWQSDGKMIARESGLLGRTPGCGERPKRPSIDSIIIATERAWPV
jgi:hypothetical protein